MTASSVGNTILNINPLNVLYYFILASLQAFPITLDKPYNHPRIQEGTLVRQIECHLREISGKKYKNTRFLLNVDN